MATSGQACLRRNLCHFRWTVQSEPPRKANPLSNASAEQESTKHNRSSITFSDTGMEPLDPRVSPTSLP